MEKDATIGMQKITGLFDAGSFVEIGAYLKRDGELTGAVCGYGAINGKLAYAFVQDSDRQKGAFDAFQAKKIGMIYDAAMKNGASRRVRSKSVAFGLPSLPILEEGLAKDLLLAALLFLILSLKVKLSFFSSGIIASYENKTSF